MSRDTQSDTLAEVHFAVEPTDVSHHQLVWPDAKPSRRTGPFARYFASCHP
jgi:hypothetical protein